MAGIVTARASLGFRLGLLGSLALMLGGCGGTVADALGMGKRSPDEFAVVRRQPLIVPPDYALRPPQPGAERPVYGRPADQAYAALTGQQPGQNPQPADAERQRDATTTLSTGQSALLARTRGGPTDPDIRQRLAAESGDAIEADPALFTRLLAAPASEAEAGGNEVPTVVRREQRPLEDLEENF